MEPQINNENIHNQLREKIIGLGETSIRKSYYSQLQNRLGEMERFRALLDQSKNVLFLVRLSDGVIVDITRAIESQLGYTSEQLLGKPVYSLFESDRAAQMAEFLAREHPIYEEFHVMSDVRNVNGSRIPMEFYMTFVEFDETKYVIGVCQDITERVGAENKISKQMDYLHALHEIDLIINAQHDMQTTLSMVLKEIIRVMQMDAACILGIQPDKSLKYLAWTGFNKENLDALPRDHLKLGTQIREYFEQPVYLPNLENFDEQFQNSPIVQGEGFRCFFSHPLIVNGRLKGALEIFNRSFITEDDLRIGFIASLAAQAAIALDKSQLLVDLQQSYVDLQTAYDATLEGWAMALELRERETGEHTKRVLNLTLQLARNVGIAGDDLIQIRRGALLHDIGKMGIPDQILLKPGPLDSYEWIIMRKHPEYAYNMLHHIDFLRPCLDIPYCHHEKWDGSGYPRGLKKLEIPLPARIFSIIDVWDALLSDRPYRKAWHQDKVVKYLKDGMGTHFDPEILETFLALIQS